MATATWAEVNRGDFVHLDRRVHRIIETLCDTGAVIVSSVDVATGARTLSSYPATSAIHRIEPSSQASTTAG